MLNVLTSRCHLLRSNTDFEEILMPRQHLDAISVMLFNMKYGLKSEAMIEREVMQ